ERDPADAWPYPPQWPPDGLRLSRLRLPGAGHGRRRAARAAPGTRGGAVTGGRPERGRGAPVVLPRPAATAVILRPSTAGLQVLLTRRPSTMQFGPDIHVFPGSRLDPGDVDAAGAAIPEAREEEGVRADPAP